MMKGNETIGCVDRSHVVTYNGQNYPCTVRRTNCDLILKESGRCQACMSLRSTLRSAVSRNSVDREKRRSPSSHTNFRFLSPAEKNQNQTLYRKLST